MRSMPFLNDNGGCKQNLQAGDSQKGLGSISANKKSSAAALLLKYGRSDRFFIRRIIVLQVIEK